MYRIYGEKTNGQRKAECLSDKPVFSWRLESDVENICQVAYEITVCKADDTVIYQSGRIEEPCTHGIRYHGPELESLTDYYWQAASYGAVKDRTSEEDCMRAEACRGAENCTSVSGKIPFTTGILDDSLWVGSWLEPDLARRPCIDSMTAKDALTDRLTYLENAEDILNPSVYYRQPVNITRPVKQAKLVSTAHGIYTSFINGDEYGQLLAPGFTSYRQYQVYQVYDVTESLHTGTNIIGAIVADGWYLGKIGLLGVGNQYGTDPAYFFQLHVTYEDGSKEIMSSGPDCRATTGAYRYGDLFIGEYYDEGLEPKNWLDPVCDLSPWKDVILRDHGYSQLGGSVDEPVRILRRKPVKRIFRAPNGDLLADVGENVAGFLSVKGYLEAGQTIQMEYCEVLDAEGNFLRNIIGQNKNQSDRYRAGISGSFAYQPRFTYHGFQYVRITGIKEADLSELTVCVIGSDLEPTGSFVCSDERLNLLQEAIFRSQQGNMISIPTDCPQREKAGWTGDMQAYTPTAVFLMDVEAFLAKWLHCMRLEQKENGSLPNVVPEIPSNMVMSHGYEETSSSAWADACVIVPYCLYMCYGDPQILQDNYPMMRKWLSYVERKAAEEVPGNWSDYSKESLEHQKYLWNTGFHYGDWLLPSLSKAGVEKSPFDVAEITKELTAPAMFAYTTDLMSRIAAILGEEEDSAYYRALNSRIKEAYAHEYLMEDGELKLPYQGIYVLALKMGLVPEGAREHLLLSLVDRIRENGGCLDTGFTSMPFLLDVLYDNGRKKEAFDLLFQDRCPSWLYEIKMGANTIWESWTNIKEDGSRNKSSYNHFAFGCVGDFIYRRILGINCLEAGYSKVVICPDPSCGLTWAKGRYQSVLGCIEVEWSADGEDNYLNVIIPPGMEAQIIWQGQSLQAGCGSWRLAIEEPG